MTILKSLPVLVAAGFAVLVAGCQSGSSNPEVTFERGKILAERGQHPEAIALYDEVQKEFPERPDVFFLRGVSYQAINLFEKSLENYRRCLELEPAHSGALNNCGVVLAKLGQFEDAANQFSALIGQNPADVLALRNRGLCLHDLQRFDEALVDYNEAVRLAPTDVECWFQRGNVYLEQDKLDLAEADYTKAIEVDGNFAKAWMNRGVARFNLGQRETAMEDLKHASDLDSNIVLPGLNWAEIAPSTELVAAKPVFQEATLQTATAVAWDACLTFASATLVEKGYSNVKVAENFPARQCAQLEGERDGTPIMILVTFRNSGTTAFTLPSLSTSAAPPSLTLLVVTTEQTADLESSLKVDQLSEGWQPAPESIQFIVINPAPLAIPAE